ncbi:MAG: hypothetical protein AB7S26_40210 [Sandaracinaceae bacterium]
MDQMTPRCRLLAIDIRSGRDGSIRSTVTATENYPRALVESDDEAITLEEPRVDRSATVFWTSVRTLWNDVERHDWFLGRDVFTRVTVDVELAETQRLLEPDGPAWNASTPWRIARAEGRAIAALRVPVGVEAPDAIRFPFSVRVTDASVLAALRGEEYVEHAIRKRALRFVGAQWSEPLAVAHTVEGEIATVPPCRLLVITSQELDRWHAAPSQLFTMLEPHVWQAALVIREGARERAWLAAMYRKIFHDWPLDRSVAHAETDDPRASGDAILVLRPGGETSLSLARSVAEEAGVLQLPPWLDELEPLAARPESGPKSMPAPRTRARVIRDDVTRHLRDARAKMRAEATFLSNLDFAHEEHSLDLVLRARGELAASSAVEDLEAAVDDDPELTHRYTSVWLERDGQVVEGTIARGERTELCVQVTAQKLAERFASAFPDAVVRHLLDAPGRDAELTVALFYPEGKVDGPRRASMTLPWLADSKVCKILARPLELGDIPVRVAIYYRNVLLQSVAVTLLVTEHADPNGPSASFELDYVATEDFHRLAELDGDPRPLSLFINRTGETHWMGLRAEGAPSLDLALREIAEEDLRKYAALSQVALQDAHSVMKEGVRSHRYRDALSDANRAERETILVELARAGRVLFTDLFLLAADVDAHADDPDYRAALDGVRGEGVVRIDRIDATADCVPWGLVYDRELDVQDPNLALCPGAARRIADRGVGGAVTCGSDASCVRDRRHVCPFGFWGLRNRIEQPLAATKTADGDTLRVNVSSGPHLVSPEDVVYAYDPRLTGAKDHADAVRDALRGARSLRSLKDRSEVLDAFLDRDAPIYYLMCHGAKDPKLGTFVLRMRDRNGNVSNIDATSLTTATPRVHPFLAVLNACETTATRADVIHRLLAALARIGAIGIVGTEVPVARTFAMSYGAQLVERLGRGESLAAILRDLRWEFLASSLDPSGLIYTAYGPVDLTLTPVGDPPS